MKPLEVLFKGIQDGSVTMEELQTHISDVVKRAKAKAKKETTGEDAELNELRKKNEELIKQYRDLQETLKKYEGNEESIEELQKKIDELEEARLTESERVQKEWEKQVDRLKQQVDVTSTQKQNMFDLYKKERLLNTVVQKANELHIKNAPFFAEDMINYNYIDLKEVQDKDGNVSFVPVTREIRYEDPSTGRELSQVFEGDDLAKGLKILVENDPRIKELYPVIENAAKGSGSSFNSNDGGQKSFDQMSPDELQKMAEDYANSGGS